MRTYIVPGRIELVGKHVDYAGGRSLTCAVDLAITARANPLNPPVIRVTAAGRRGRVEIPLSAAAAASGPPWSSYVAAVARRFARDFPEARRGLDLRLRSDLPPSAGLSSSSAIIVAIAWALADVNEMDASARWRELIPSAIARAEYFAAMETGAPYGPFAGDAGVGVRGGAQDPIAILCAEANSVGQFSYLPARLERRVPWPDGWVIVVGVSGIRATKTGNAREDYNRAADATRALVGAWNASTGRNDLTLADALASGPDARTTLQREAEKGVGDFSADYLVPRLAQYREEVEVIVPGVGDALRDQDFTALGQLVDRSQEMAERALRNQVPETIHLAQSAREGGAVAASAFGAGFGGAVWAMVRASDAESFQEKWRAGYEKAFPDCATTARWLITKPSAPALQLPRSSAA
ncbi:MAG TPA: galactokinase family protein [Gemmatimonadaceae bacterium]|jgi:galactokinase